MKWLQRLIGKWRHSSPANTEAELDVLLTAAAPIDKPSVQRHKPQRSYTGEGSLTQQHILDALAQYEPQTAVELSALQDVSTVPWHLAMMVKTGKLRKLVIPGSRRAWYMRTTTLEEPQSVAAVDPHVDIRER